MVKGKSGQERMVDITDAASDECPVSVMSRHPQMIVLVDRIQAMNRTYKACNAVPYGHDTNRWPAKWCDLVSWAELEDWRITDAIDKTTDMGGI